MLVIKLSRIGKKNRPYYRLIVTEKGRDPFGKTLEIFGNYNPHSKKLEVKEERIKYWLGKGAQTTPTINNLLVEKGVIQGKKVRASRDPKNKKGARIKNDEANKVTSAGAKEKAEAEKVTETIEKKEEIA